MMRGRRLLRRLPVARRAAAAVAALRAERDALRQERDHLRRQLGTVDHPPPMLVAPSLLARTETLRRVRRQARELHGAADPVWAYNDKVAGARLAADLGIATPTQLRPPTPLTELEPPRQRCVVKPLEGASARGVAPLVPDGDDGWLDLFDLDRGPRGWDDIRAELAEVVGPGRASERFLVEELLEGPDPLSLPDDWKVLCVGGQAVLIYALAGRSPKHPERLRYRYFSPSWEDLGAIRTQERIDPDIGLPQHPQELLEAAEAVARALPAPFVRIDLFDTPQRVVFGEITPEPGSTMWFGPELDQAIGEVWDRAEARSWRPDGDGS